MRCHDNRAQVCEWGENGVGLVWTGNDCGAGSCRLPRAPDTQSFCTLEKEPDERCVNDAVATGFPSAFSFCAGFRARMEGPA